MADTTISSLNTVNALSAVNYIPVSDGTNTTKLGTDSLFGFRNRIINGNMQIWQRGTSFSDGSGYTADRWFVNRATGSTGLTSNRQGTYNSTLRMTRNQGNTSTSHFDFRQAIETQNCVDLAGKQVTFSFNAAKESNFTPPACYIEINYSTNVDEAINSVSWISLGFRQFNPTTNFQRFSQTYTIPSNALTLMVRIISGSYVGTAPANDAIEITQLQLEEGSTATPFEFRPIGTELALCQRYYYKLSNSTVNLTTLTFVNSYAGNRAFGGISIPVTMRNIYPITTFNKVTLRSSGFLNDYNVSELYAYDKVEGNIISLEARTASSVLGTGNFFHLNLLNGNTAGGTSFIAFETEL